MNPENLKRLIKERIQVLLSEQDEPTEGPGMDQVYAQLRPMLARINEDPSVADEIKTAADALLRILPDAPAEV
jgi:hypothetical protein